MIQNYFTLLGLEPRFDVDVAALHNAYVTMQQQTHPDRMLGKSDKERAKAIQLSMDANQAYETLKDPLTRAQHLLKLQGIIVNADGEDTLKPSQALLMESMEIREQLAQADSEIEIARASSDLKKAGRECEARLSACFVREAYEEAAEETIRLRYLGKALEEAMVRHYQLKAVVS